MSTAIVLGRFDPIGNDQYQPVTEGSLAIHKTWEKEKHYLLGSASDWSPVIEEALHRIKSECSVADWDGSGAAPIAIRTVELAQRIVATLYALLPKGTPPPDLVPEADGEICISWMVDSDRIFSLSVGEHGKINFAGQFGNDGGIHAWQPINSTSGSALENSLEDVARYIDRLHAPPAFRVAA